MIANRYRTLQLLGKGEMSVVWLALDTRTQERVAFKIMTTIPEDDELYKKAQERFLREIKIASSLQHPHILSILDHGSIHYEERHVPYLVTPYMPDGSLADLIRHKPPWKHWTLQQTADAIMQAAESLHHLHTRTPAIVHEDVKPGNFLVRLMQDAERAAHLYLCDFGISRWKQASAMASEVIGTFAFMSPEQANGEVDCASDQYSLAVMACYMLTGQLPLRITTAKDLEILHEAQALPPGLLNPERISSFDVDAIILRALEKRPEKRFPSVLEFAQQLQAAIKEYVQEEAAAKTEKVDLPVSQIKQINQVSQTDQARQTSMTSQTAHVEKQNVPIKNTPVQSAPAHAEPMMAITLDPLDANEERILDEPLPSRPSRGGLPINIAEEVFFSPLSFKGPVSLSLPARPKLVSWVHDSSGFAATFYGHAPLFLYRDGTTQEIQTPNATQTANLCWSPDGRVLAISTQGKIFFWDRMERRALPLELHSNTRAIEALDWSIAEQLALWADNQIFVYNLPYQNLLHQQAPAPQVIATATMRPGNTGVLGWSPDGTLLVAGASNGEVVGWKNGRQAQAWQIEERGQKVQGLAWSPDGSLLAIAFRDNRVIGWNMRTKSRAFQWQKLPAMPRSLSISPSNQIAIASAEQRLLLGFANETSPSATLPGQLLVAWSPTRCELATLDEQQETLLTLWRA